MGACSARIFKRGDAGRLIGVCTRKRASIDIGYAEASGLSRVEIGVENAVAATELQLEAPALAHLQCRRAEMTDQVLRRHTNEPGRLPLRSRNRDWRRGGRWLLGSSGAGRKQQDGRGENYSAHGRRMPAAVRRGKVAHA